MTADVLENLAVFLNIAYDKKQCQDNEMKQHSCKYVRVFQTALSCIYQTTLVFLHSCLYEVRPSLHRAFIKENKQHLNCILAGMETRWLSGLRIRHKLLKVKNKAQLFLINFKSKSNFSLVFIKLRCVHAEVQE